MVAIRQLQANWPRALLVLITVLALVTATPAASASLNVPSAASMRPAPALPAAGDGIPLLHGTPAYDSGWTAMAKDSTHTFDHNLGGDTDDYVVDLQFRDSIHLGVVFDVHQIGYGLNSYGTYVHGAYWQNLTSSQIEVFRGIDDYRTEEVRVRIWRVPTADYDSGWQSIDPDEDKRFTHGLGGNPDDYVVDMQFKSALHGVHQLHYGGDRYLHGVTVRERGAFWHSLGPSSITVHRGYDDSSCVQQVRVRIWRRPHPDYVSSWTSLPVGGAISLAHWLSGPWNDYVVDLQFRDTDDDGYGVNQMGYGLDFYQDAEGTLRDRGAAWHSLDGLKLSVLRGGNNFAADQVRVRIWASRAPKYDSGWMAVGRESGHSFEHNLGGNSDTYVMDLQLKDMDDGFGINQRGYGADFDYDFGAGDDSLEGVAWYALNTTSVYVYRYGDDESADRVRVRLWIAPVPAYDSRWRGIGQGESLTLTHNLHYRGYHPDYFVVDLQFKQDGGAGVNQWWYGGDSLFSGGTTFRAIGANWRALDDTSIVVDRLSDDVVADEVRVRIWYNSSFDYDSLRYDIDKGSARPFSFSLGACARDPVVDLQFLDKDDPTNGVNNLYYGGNLLQGYGQSEFGAWWQNLTSSSVTVQRGASDMNADRARVRIWATQGCRVYVPVVLRGG